MAGSPGNRELTNEGHSLLPQIVLGCLSRKLP